MLANEPCFVAMPGSGTAHRSSGNRNKQSVALDLKSSEGVAIACELIATADVVVDIGPEPSRGRTHVDLSRLTAWESNCSVAVDIDAGVFREMLITRIASLG